MLAHLEMEYLIFYLKIISLLQYNTEMAFKLKLSLGQWDT